MESLPVPEATLRVLLGVAVAVPLFALVAAILGHTFSIARRETLNFVRQWAAVAPTEVRKSLRMTLGVSLTFTFLLAAGWISDRVADFDPFMPALSRPFGFFGYEDIRWSSEHHERWKEFETELATAWETAHQSKTPEKEEAWRRLKNDAGKNKVRASRALTVMAMLIIIAGLVDVAKNKRFRLRGAALVVIGVVMTVLFTAIWVNEHSGFNRRIIRANATLGNHAVSVPDTYPR